MGSEMCIRDRANGCPGRSTEPPEESSSAPEGETPPLHVPVREVQEGMLPHAGGASFLVATYNCNSLSRRQWDELALHSEMEGIVAVAVQEHKLESTSGLLAYTGSDLYTPWFDPVKPPVLVGKQVVWVGRFASPGSIASKRRTLSLRRHS